jgi:hypothetical protein
MAMVVVFKEYSYFNLICILEIIQTKNPLHQKIKVDFFSNKKNEILSLYFNAECNILTQMFWVAVVKRHPS